MLRPIAAGLISIVLPMCITTEPCPESTQTTIEGGQGSVSGITVVNQVANAASRRKTTRHTAKQTPAVDQLHVPKRQAGKPGLNPIRTCFGEWDAYRCIAPPKTTKPKKKSTNPSPATHLREVVAKLQLPDPTPRIGPNPNNNQWNMLTVGYPIWLWTDTPNKLTTTTHHNGLTFNLTATKQTTTFNTGDGNTKTCTHTTPYPKTTKPGTPSPTCNHTYQTPSPKNHPYTLTATTHWQITWNSAGQHGTLQHHLTATQTLNIGELTSLVKG